MKNIPMLLLLLLAIAASVLSIPAMQSPPSEYEIMHYKHTLGQRLCSAIFDQASFKATHAEYRTFFNNQKYEIIEKSLKNSFHAAMKQELAKLQEWQITMSHWQNSIKDKTFLKNMNKPLVAQGLALIVLCPLLGYLTVKESMKPRDPEGILCAFYTIACLVSGLIGSAISAQGWNYTEYLQSTLDSKIDVLNTNYAYAYPHENQLSLIAK